MQRQKLAFENNSRVLSATKGRFMSWLVFCVMPHGSAFMSILQSDIEYLHEGTVRYKS